MSDKHVLYMIGGVPGSGKSWLARILRHHSEANNVECLCVAADDFMFDDKGDYKFDPSRLGICHLWCQSSVLEAMKREVPNIVVHNTFVRQWERDVYRELAKEFAYQIMEIDCDARFGNIHGVPEEKVDKMRVMWEFVAKGEKV